MAFISAQDQTASQYTYQRYPMVLHRGHHPNIESCFVHNEADEATAVEAGWSTQRPAMPEPEPEKVPVSLEERVAALEEAVALLTAPAPDAPKRGPGRPKKENPDAS